jgi:hypothetical protein
MNIITNVTQNVMNTRIAIKNQILNSTYYKHLNIMRTLKLSHQRKSEYLL